MVKVLIKRADETFFLYDTRTSVKVCDLLKDLVTVHNGIFKILEFCVEVEGLAKHGVCASLREHLDQSIGELNLTDNSSEDFIPDGGYVECSDPSNVRCGHAPKEEMANILYKVLQEARARVSKNQAGSNVCLSISLIKETFEILASSVSIVYPMGLPVHDPLHKDLKKIQDDSKSFVQDLSTKDSLQASETELWWAGKKLEPDKELSNYVGKNEKTRITAKLQKKGMGPPPREPSMTQEQVQQMMLLQYKRQEELRKLNEDEDNTYLDSEWADNHYLKKSFQGLKDVKWK